MKFIAFPTIASFSVLIVLFSISHGFITERNVLQFRAIKPAQSIGTVHHEATKYEAKKVPSTEEPKKGIDYAFVVQQLLSPANPYSWFLYFFVGINVFNAIQSQ